MFGRLGWSVLLLLCTGPALACGSGSTVSATCAPGTASSSGRCTDSGVAPAWDGGTTGTTTEAGVPVATADDSGASVTNEPGTEDAAVGESAEAGEGGEAEEAGATDGGTEFACDDSPTTGFCVIYSVSGSAAAAQESDCTQQGGTVRSTCPAAHLLGCCLVLGTNECLYAPTFTSSIQQSCADNKGTWSTSP